MHLQVSGMMKTIAARCFALTVGVLLFASPVANGFAADELTPAVTGRTPGRPLLYVSAMSAYCGYGVALQRGCYGDPTYYRMYTGPADFQLDLLTLGVGYGNRNIGFMFATKGMEVVPSGWSGDYVVAGGPLPAYVYAVSGMRSGWVNARPTFYAWFGGTFWGMLYDMPYFQTGIGAKWRFYAVSPAVQVKWRRVWHERRFAHNDFITVGLRLELGGWWPLGASGE